MTLPFKRSYQIFYFFLSIWEWAGPTSIVSLSCVLFEILSLSCVLLSCLLSHCIAYYSQIVTLVLRIICDSDLVLPIVVLPIPEGSRILCPPREMAWSVSINQHQLCFLPATLHLQVIGLTSFRRLALGRRLISSFLRGAGGGGGPRSEPPTPLEEEIWAT